jgi:hypothetical protein
MSSACRGSPAANAATLPRAAKRRFTLRSTATPQDRTARRFLHGRGTILSLQGRLTEKEPRNDYLLKADAARAMVAETADSHSDRWKRKGDTDRMRRRSSIARNRNGSGALAKCGGSGASEESNGGRRWPRTTSTSVTRTFSPTSPMA